MTELGTGEGGEEKEREMEIHLQTQDEHTRHSCDIFLMCGHAGIFLVWKIEAGAPRPSRRLLMGVKCEADRGLAFV